MSFWTDALRALQQVTLLQHKVQQALTTAEEARRHSIETRERLIRLETLIDIAMKPRPAAAAASGRVETIHISPSPP